jgi:hypothetical protein
MAAWLDQNLETHTIRDRYGDSHGLIEVVPAEAVLALLKGKVLCDAEPVACMMVNRTHKIAPSLHWHPVNDWHITWEPVPLYAPASLSGNADMGKEGNE